MFKRSNTVPGLRLHNYFATEKLVTNLLCALSKYICILICRKYSFQSGKFCIHNSRNFGDVNLICLDKKDNSSTSSSVKKNVLIHYLDLFQSSVKLISFSKWGMNNEPQRFNQLVCQNEF